ncbi:Thioredoxin [Porphyridium purpureum]|uniref:Thioredoxin n=1 Tax=Porphyridium purpureum TaxID=35688 RepID=A0A5J4Z913_PORPP|nr:Thioredoxin [Porphyridium purpureum]|eukprot:POR7432..scf295_1
MAFAGAPIGGDGSKSSRHVTSASSRICAPTRVVGRTPPSAVRVSCAPAQPHTDATPFVHSKEELERVVQESPLVFCFVHAPWCKACQRIKMNGSFEQATKKFPRVTAVQCDVESSKELKPMLAVRSVPSFVVYREGKRVDHFNAKTLEDLVEQMGDYAA